MIWHKIVDKSPPINTWILAKSVKTLGERDYEAMKFIDKREIDRIFDQFSYIEWTVINE